MTSIRDALSSTWLKDSFLLGVDLTLDDGSPYPNSIFDQSIDAAIAYLEHEIGIVVDENEFTNERHDAIDMQRSAWWPLRLDMRPVINVTRFSIKFGNYQPVNIPTSWCQLLSPIHGQVHLIPSEESLGSYLFRAGVPLIMGDTMTPYQYIPGYFEIDYKAGFAMRSGDATILDGTKSIDVVFDEEMLTNHFTLDFNTADTALGRVSISNRTVKGCTINTANVAAAGNGALTWGVTTIPADIKHCIGLKAALLPLDVAGDLIAGAGVANYSIGADGVHQSLGTTSSATNCLHPDTKIALADGTLPTIKSLVGRKSFDVACVDADGNAVVGKGHSARKTIEDDVLAVTLSNGETVYCNGSHPFRAANGVYIEAKDLVCSQVLTTCALLTDDKMVRALGVEPTGEKIDLYDITVDEHHCFGIGQGVIVHNSGYGARVLQFERELKALLPALRAKYKIMNFGAM